MIIHLLRHGISIDRADPECPEDSRRFLTARGRRRTKAAARGLVTLGLSVDAVLCSPFLRAQQTAQITMKVLGIEAGAIETEALLWDAEPTVLQQQLIEMSSECDSVLCVGHAPQLDLFIAHMVGTPMPVTELKKAGMATLRCDFNEPGDGILTGVYEPRVLRALGRC